MSASRWNGELARYSNKRTVEHTRSIIDARGVRRTKTDTPTETEFCARARESAGWRHGARIVKR